MRRRRFDHEAFRRMREDHGLSIRDLSKASGVSRSALEKLEQGLRTRPQPATYRGIREAFGLPPGALLVDVEDDAPAISR